MNRSPGHTIVGMTWTVFLLAVGAVARLSWFVSRDYLARRIRLPIVHRFGPESDWAYLVTCPWCLSIWFGAVVVPLAWFFGETVWFIIPAGILTASFLVGAAASFIDVED